MGDKIFVYKTLIPHKATTNIKDIRWTESEEKKRRRALRKMDMLRRKILEPIAVPNMDGNGNIVPNASSMEQTGCDNTSKTPKKFTVPSLPEIKILLDRVINIPASGKGTVDTKVVEKVFITNSCDESDLSEEEMEAITNADESDVSEDDIEDFCVSGDQVNISKTPADSEEDNSDDSDSSDDAEMEDSCSDILKKWDLPELKICLERIDFEPPKSGQTSSRSEEEETLDTDSLNKSSVASNRTGSSVRVEKGAVIGKDNDTDGSKTLNEAVAEWKPNPYVRLERLLPSDIKTALKSTSKKKYGVFPKAMVVLKRLPDSVLIKRGIPLVQSNLWEMERKDENQKMYCVLGIKLFLQKRNQENLFVQRVADLREKVIPKIIQKGRFDPIPISRN